MSMGFGVRSAGRACRATFWKPAMGATNGGLTPFTRPCVFAARVNGLGRLTPEECDPFASVATALQAHNRPRIHHERRFCRHEASFVLQALCAVLLFVTGCGGTRTGVAAYSVEIPNPRNTDSLLIVTLHLSSMGADSLRLYASTPIPPSAFTEIRLIDSGRTVPMQAVVVKDRPAWVALMPSSRHVDVSYRVRLGMREGNPHMGYSNRTYGRIGTDYSAFVGRHVLLIPELWPRLQSASVTIIPTLGDNEDVTSTLPGKSLLRGKRWTYVASLGDLLGASWLVGNIRADTMRCGQATYYLQHPSAEDSLYRTVTRPRLSQALFALDRLVGRTWHQDQTLLLLPNREAGTIEVGEGMRLGQSIPGTPLTERRMQELLSNIASTYLRTSARTFSLRDRSQFWFVDGLERWVALRTTYASSGRSDGDFRRSLAEQLVHLRAVEGLDLNLERLYDVDPRSPLVTRILAPAMVEEIDWRMRRSSSGKIGIEDLIELLSRNPRPADLWQSVMGVVGRATVDSLEQQACGGLCTSATFAPAPLKPVAHLPKIGWTGANNGLLILASGDLEGYLENCGCRSSQAGGMPRRATAVRDLRRRSRACLQLDAGGFLAEPEKQLGNDAPSEVEQELFLELLRGLDYDALALGGPELASDPAWLRRATRLGLPLVCANVLRDGRRIVPAYVVREWGGWKLGIIGLYEPPAPEEQNDALDRKLAAYLVDSPRASYERCAAELGPTVDFLVVIGTVSPSLARELVGASKPPALIVSRAAVPLVSTPAGPKRADTSGILDETTLLYAASTRYGIDFANLPSGGRLAWGGVKLGDVRLDDGIADAPDVRRQLDRFYANVERMYSVEGVVHPLALGDSAAARGGYVGAGGCKACHASEYAQWKATPHATAFKTLLDVHRNFQPRCVVCHVVGLGVPGGYRIGMRNEDLANVQCESCHGSGVLHVSAPTIGRLRRQVGEEVCVTCHTTSHSEAFHYAERIQKVRHEGGAMVATHD